MIGTDTDTHYTSLIYKLFDKYAGDDRVLPTRNGCPKILTLYKDNPYSYELLPEYLSLAREAYHKRKHRIGMASLPPPKSFASLLLPPQSYRPADFPYASLGVSSSPNSPLDDSRRIPTTVSVSRSTRS